MAQALMLSTGTTGALLRKLPAVVRRNRTHLVWQGAASPALRRLMELLPTLPDDAGAASGAAPATLPGL